MVPTLKTERMWARPVQAGDAEQVQRIFPRREIVKHVGAVVPWPNPADGALPTLSNVGA
jgi:[ribosomal protein S5]-alanine N-acetyltransferase